MELFKILGILVCISSSLGNPQNYFYFQRSNHPTIFHRFDQTSVESPDPGQQRIIETPTLLNQQNLETPAIHQFALPNPEFDASTEEEEEANNEQFQPMPAFRHRVHSADKRKRRPNLFHQAVNKLFRFKNNQQNHFHRQHRQHLREKPKHPFHHHHSSEKVQPPSHHQHSTEKLQHPFYYIHSNEERQPQFQQQHSAEIMQSKSFQTYPSNPNPTPTQLFAIQPRPYVPPQMAQSIQLPDFTHLQPNPAPPHQPIQFHVTEINTSGPKHHGFSYTVDNNDNVKFSSSFNFGSSQSPATLNYAPPTILSPVSSPTRTYPLIPVSKTTGKQIELETKTPADINQVHSADPESKFGNKITPKVYTNLINQNPIKIETYVHPEFYVIPNAISKAPPKQTAPTLIAPKRSEYDTNKNQIISPDLTTASPEIAKNQATIYGFRINNSSSSSANYLSENGNAPGNKVPSPPAANTVTLDLKESELFDSQKQKFQTKPEHGEYKGPLKLSNSEEKGLAHIEHFKKTVNSALEEIKEPERLDTLQEVNETKIEKLSSIGLLDLGRPTQQSDQAHIEQFQKTVSLALEGIEETEQLYNPQPTIPEEIEKNNDQSFTLVEPEINYNPAPTTQVDFEEPLVLDEIGESENLENPQPTHQAQVAEFRKSPPLSFSEVDERESPEPTSQAEADIELLKTQKESLEEIEIHESPEPTIQGKVELLSVSNETPLYLTETEDIKEDSPQPTDEVNLEHLIFGQEEEPELLVSSLSTNQTKSDELFIQPVVEENILEKSQIQNENETQPLENIGSLSLEKTKESQQPDLTEPTNFTKTDESVPVAAEINEQLISEAQVTTSSPIILNSEFDESKELEFDKLTSILGTSSATRDHINDDKFQLDLKKEKIRNLSNENDQTTSRTTDTGNLGNISVPENPKIELLEDHNLEEHNEHLNQSLEEPNKHLNHNLEEPNEHLNQNLEEPKEPLNQNLEEPNEHLNQNLEEPKEPLNQNLEEPNAHLDQNLEEPNKHLNHNLEEPNEHLDQNLEEPNEHLNQNSEEPNGQLKDFPTVNNILKPEFPFANRLLLENSLSKSSLGISKYEIFNAQLETFAHPFKTTTIASSTIPTTTIVPPTNPTTTIIPSSSTPDPEPIIPSSTTPSVPEIVDEFLHPNIRNPFPAAPFLENIPTTIMPGGIFDLDNLLNSTVLETDKVEREPEPEMQKDEIDSNKSDPPESELLVTTTTTEIPESELIEPSSPSPPSPILRLSLPVHHGESNEISRSYNNGTRRIKVVIKRKLGRRRAHVYKL